jgi:hypothetical protein
VLIDRAEINLSELLDTARQRLTYWHASTVQNRLLAGKT